MKGLYLNIKGNFMMHNISFEKNNGVILYINTCMGAEEVENLNIYIKLIVYDYLFYHTDYIIV